MPTLNISQARKFLLIKQGLISFHKFAGKQGTLDFIRQAGCLQFDPVDLCGKNAELALHARVKDFTKSTLNELLYTNRQLFDYPDKQLSIIPIEYWPYFSRFRDAAHANLDKFPEVAGHIETVRAYIEESGPICSDDFTIEGETKWWSAINWSSGGKLLRSVLEQMYSQGVLVVHHKKGTRRYYDLATRHIPAEILNAPDPFPDDFAHIKWRILRRIGAVGLLWNLSSDAWLGIWGITPEVRNKAFAALVDDGEIAQVTVDGIKAKFYYRTSDMPIMESVLSGTEFKPRTELIAPLDPFMWDRKLIHAIFNFAYTWEIYTPAHKRKYGAYVLPILHGERFIGRVEAVRDSKANQLVIKNIWCEDGVRQTKKLDSSVHARLKKLAEFNDCTLKGTDKCD